MVGVWLIGIPKRFALSIIVRTIKKSLAKDLDFVAQDGCPREIGNALGTAKVQFKQKGADVPCDACWLEPCDLQQRMSGHGIRDGVYEPSN